MTKKVNVLGMLVFVLVFGMTVIACSPSEGTLTVTDIPAKFNGMYAIFEGEGRSTELIGAQTYDAENWTGTGARIQNGTVRIPVWMEEDGVRYKGSQTFDIWVIILNSPSFDEADDIAEIEFEYVTFSNGSARVSFHDNDDFWEYQ